HERARPGAHHHRARGPTDGLAHAPDPHLARQEQAQAAEPRGDDRRPPARPADRGQVRERGSAPSGRLGEDRGRHALITDYFVSSSLSIPSTGCHTTSSAIEAMSFSPGSPPSHTGRSWQSPKKAPRSADV